ncbi:MAG: hypothetical protein O3C43_20965 [Verrucomicrobia bacterium]|nr:hypothetical protein [Verrucomicrobiota bacterium]
MKYEKNPTSAASPLKSKFLLVIAPHLAPPLSCAGAEESQVYEKAAALILGLIEDPAAEPRTVRTNARFIKRGSV